MYEMGVQHMDRSINLQIHESASSQVPTLLSSPPPFPTLFYSYMSQYLKPFYDVYSEHIAVLVAG
jgi:hypothetical protein